MWAAHNGRTACVRQLLKLGANKNAKDKVRRVILCFECLSRFACIDLIIVWFFGLARVRAFSWNHVSAHVFNAHLLFSSCVVLGCCRLARLLFGGELTRSDSDCPVVLHACVPKTQYEDTPLICAAAYGRVDCVRILLEHGADKEATGVVCDMICRCCWSCFGFQHLDFHMKPTSLCF
jgi:hypothetical protein